MRYNIKRLFNEVITHERDLARLKKLYDFSPAYGEIGCNRQDISSQMNSKRHAKSLCLRFIGDEAVQRWKEGKNLNYETEEVVLIK